MSGKIFTPITISYRLCTMFMVMALVLFSTSLSAELSEDIQNLIVTVIDGGTNEPLVAVSVFTADHKFVSFTDEKGQTTIDMLSHREMVNFSYVGYDEVSIPYFELRKNNGVIKMFASSNLVDSIVVIGRRDDPIEEIPYVVQRVTQEEIAFKNTQTPADALAASADVFVQKSQLGGGSPIIRGFEANKVLMVVDGVRMNNAIYREGHLQNSITLDNAILDQAEVIYGPGSLMYGSDALGGVVHFRTRDPKVLYDLSKSYSKMEAGAYTRFSSANKEKAVHVDLDYRTSEWGSMTSLSLVNYGDLRVGSKRPEAFPNMGIRPYSQLRIEGQDQVAGPWQSQDIQRSTGYSQFDLLQKVKYQPSDSLYFILNVQYSTSTNIPRYDNLQDTVATARELKWSEWYYGPQKRLLTSLKMRMLKPRVFYDKGTIIGAFQKLEEDRLKRKFAGAQRTFNTEDVYVYSLTADFDKNLNKKGTQTFSYGVDGAHNRVFSDAGKIHLRTGRVSRGGVFTRYPSDYSTMTSYGGYINYRLRSQDSVFVFNAGARYSVVSLFAQYDTADLELIDWPSAYTTTGISAKNNDLTWGAGFTINTKNKWQIRSLVSTAFRSPNIDDFAKVRVKDQFAVLPNTSLRPERSISGELTLGKEIGRARPEGGASLYLSGTGFYTYLKDAIVRRLSTQPNGDSTILVENEPNPLFNVQQNINQNYAIVYGVSGNLVFKIKDVWRLKAGMNYTQGRSQLLIPSPAGTNTTIDTLVPLAHIPPRYGQVGLLFKKKRFKIEGVARFAAAKPLNEYAVTAANFDDNKNLILDRRGSSDNPEFTPFILNEDGDIEHVGSLAWTTYNIYSSFKLSKQISIDLAVENITDLHYLPFSSGISAPGRNFILTVRGKF